jgi:hypothetical protein
MMTRKITFDAVFREAFAVGARNIILFGLGALGLAVFYTIVDTWGHGQSIRFQNIVNIAVGYFVLRSVLSKEHLIETEGKGGTYWIVSLLIGLGVLLGFVLLVVPGLYLLARWSLAPALTVSRDRRAIQAMRESWTITAGSAWPLVLAYLACGIAVLAAIVVVTAIAGLANSGDEWLVPTFATDTLPALLSMGGTGLNVAVYRLLTGAGAELEEVFA